MHCLSGREMVRLVNPAYRPVAPCQRAHKRSHAASLLVVVANNVLVVGVRMLGEVALDEVARLLSAESEQDVHLGGVQCKRAGFVVRYRGTTAKHVGSNKEVPAPPIRAEMQGAVLLPSS